MASFATEIQLPWEAFNVHPPTTNVIPRPTPAPVSSQLPVPPLPQPSNVPQKDSSPIPVPAPRISTVLPLLPLLRLGSVQITLSTIR